MNRVLKKGGRALITVWAKEQKYKEKESFYISSKGKNEKKTKPCDDGDDDKTTSQGNVHTFGKEFQKKDVFVAWRMKQPGKEKKPTSTREEETNATKTNDVYLRFYHVFEQNELEKLFESIRGTRIVESFYEQGNWCVIFEKI